MNVWLVLNCKEEKALGRRRRKNSQGRVTQPGHVTDNFSTYSRDRCINIALGVKNILEYLSTDIICSEKRTGFREQGSGAIERTANRIQTKNGRYKNVLSKKTRKTDMSVHKRFKSP